MARSTVVCTQSRGKNQVRFMKYGKEGKEKGFTADAAMSVLISTSSPFRIGFFLFVCL